MYTRLIYEQVYIYFYGSSHQLQICIIILQNTPKIRFIYTRKNGKIIIINKQTARYCVCVCMNLRFAHTNGTINTKKWVEKNERQGKMR